MQASNVLNGGEYEVRADGICPDGVPDEYHVELWIRSTTGNEFVIGYQKYTFTYSNASAIESPVADGTGGLVGVVYNDDGSGSYYNAPYLSAPYNNSISYNIDGDGYLVTDTWTKAGTVIFDLIGDDCDVVDIDWSETQTSIHGRRNGVPGYITGVGYDFRRECLGPHGQYDILLEGCLNDLGTKYIVDVLLSATTEDTEFYVSDQNYRFSFNPGTLANPTHVSGSGLDGPAGNANYGFITTTGSIDTIVSYNIVLGTNAPGVEIEHGIWTLVGQVEFNFLSDAVPVGLTLHDHDPINFPPTFIGETHCNVLYGVSEGNYDEDDGDVCEEQCSSSFFSCNYFEPSNSSNECENGLDIWNLGGSDCIYNINNSNYARSGDYCIRLRDNSSTSTFTTDNLDLSSFQELTVDFSFITSSMETGEDFWLQISTDGGNTFTTVQDWVSGIGSSSKDFWNDTRYVERIFIPGPFTSTTQVRFRCDATDNGDNVYLDDVVLTGCATTPFTENPTTSAQEEVIIDNRHTSPVVTNHTQEKATMKAFPNPVSSELTVDLNVNTTTESQLLITDFTGRTIARQIVPANTGQQKININVADYEAGFYFITLVTDVEKVTQKIVVVK